MEVVHTEPAAAGPPPLTAEQEAMVEGCDRLAWKVARDMLRYYPRADVNDLYAEAKMAMVRAARDFDPGRGYKFATLAHKYATNAARRYAEKDSLFGMDMIPREVRRTGGVKTASLDAERGGGDGFTIGGTLADHREPVPGVGRADDPVVEKTPDWWRKVLAGMPDRWADVILFRYRDGLSNGEVSDEMGTSRQRVSQIEAKALEWLRERRPELAGLLVL